MERNFFLDKFLYTCIEEKKEYFMYFNDFIPFNLLNSDRCNKTQVSWLHKKAKLERVNKKHAFFCETCIRITFDGYAFFSRLFVNVKGYFAVFFLFKNSVVSTFPLTKLFLRKKELSLSYNAHGACFKPYNAL